MLNFRSVNPKQVKPQVCRNVQQSDALPRSSMAGKTRSMSSAVTTKPAALPKVTVRVDVWMTEDMKDQIDALLLARMSATGHRLTLSDLGREAFLLLLKQAQPLPQVANN